LTSYLTNKSVGGKVPLTLNDRRFKKMNKKYYDNKILMQNLQDEIQSIKEKEDNLYKISINDEN